jgi:hypothetical protein
MKRTYELHRWVLEKYEIEIDSERPPDKKTIVGMAHDPFSITVLRHKAIFIEQSRQTRKEKA